MGGIAIVGARVVGYLVAHVRTEQIKFARAGHHAAWSLIVGHRARRLRRRLPRRAQRPEPRAAQARQDRRAAARRGRRSRSSRCNWVQRVDAPVVHPAARPRPRHGRLVRVGGRSSSTASANAVNLTDGLDGLAAGSAGAGVRRVRDHRASGSSATRTIYERAAGRRARPRDRRGRDAGRVRRVPVVERGAGADLHGRHRLARARRRDGGPRAAHATPSCCCRSSAASTWSRRCP